jgi:hypothetical protein
MVEGVGDEVVLFGAFLFITMCMLVYFSRRGGQGRAPEGQGNRQQDGSTGDEGSPTEPIDDNQPIRTNDSNENIARSDGTMMGSTTAQATIPQLDEFDQHQQSEESTVRSRFPSTQEARNSEEDETRHSMSIRLILPNNSILPVNVQLSTTLGEIRRTYFQEQLAQHRPVRFIYQGRVLDNDNQTLHDLEIGPHHAIHVHIGRPRPIESEGAQDFGPQQPGGMLDLSHLFLPLFGLILAICWVCMFCFPDIFSLLTKVLLFILSLVYVFMVYVSTRATPTE